MPSQRRAAPKCCRLIAQCDKRMACLVSLQSAKTLCQPSCLHSLRRPGAAPSPAPPTLWAARPLPPLLLEYAAWDVVWLPQAAGALLGPPGAPGWDLTLALSQTQVGREGHGEGGVTCQGPAQAAAPSAPLLSCAAAPC